MLPRVLFALALLQPGSEDEHKSKSGSLPSLLLNWVSLTGIFLALLGIFTGLFTLFIDALSGETQAYTGLLYLLYAGLVGLGIGLILFGILFERRRRGNGFSPSLPSDLIINLSNPSHRNTVLAVIGVAMVVLLIVVVGSYKTFHATETNAFCGQLCHSVMAPEFTTYQYSSHARVDCVECHIGSGAGWYVRSKFSGLRQILAVTLGTFPQPIPTPIHNLRPARETCEECHWPKKFIGYKDTVRSYYLADEDNSIHRIRMLMKIGGEENSLMRGSGIHYHMLLSGKVEYIARDDKRQDIAWVKITHSDGTNQVYEDNENPLTEEERQQQETRTMDCMDCHNRPAHQFPTPMPLLNQALEAGSIASTLPRIKEQGVFAMSGDYADSISAMNGIRDSIMTFYTENYPEVMENQLPQVLFAVEEVQNLYERSVFPDMKASWKSYPNNIGHRDWPGCFRCHNDRLQSKDEKTIFTTCNKCHLILAQGENVDHVEADLIKGQTFIHPGEDGEEIDEFTECTECHTGGPEVYE